MTYETDIYSYCTRTLGILDEIEYVVYRKRSRIILVAEIIIQLLLSMIMPKRFIMCFSLSFVCLATVMIVGAVKNKKNGECL